MILVRRGYSSLYFQDIIKCSLAIKKKLKCLIAARKKESVSVFLQK